MLPLSVERLGRIVRSPRWPWAVLAVCALVLFIGDSRVMIRGIPLPADVTLGTAVAAAGWVVLDASVSRLGTRSVGIILLTGASMVFAALAIAFLDVRILRAGRSTAIHVGVMAAVAAAIGAYLRAAIGRGWRPGQLVADAAGLSWVAYLDLTIQYRPFRDAQLYLGAGRLFLDHHQVYLSAPLATIPTDPTMLPYLYPPFTLPLFAGLAMLPNAVAVTILEVLCVVAVVAGLRLLGVRWRFMPVLLLWPPLAIGIQVGNVACFSFLALAAGWRAATSLPLGGVFKVQTGVLSLWLLRERHWRPLAVGSGAVAAIALAMLPLTGVSVYLDWLRALGYFQATIAMHEGVMGLALQRTFLPSVALLLAGAAIGVALLAGRRDGLARSAIAAVVASPTVYVHGLSLFLPSVLLLDAASAWGILGLMPWGASAWWGAAVTLAALVLGLTRARIAAAAPGGAGVEARDAAPFDAAVHPLGRLLEPWPDAPVRVAVPVPEADRT